MISIPAPQSRPIRALAPDLARGLMLLLIALANIPWSLWGVEKALMNAHSVDASTADKVWQFIAIVMIDARSYPLFAFLFGYGIWQLYARQQAAGVTAREARKLLQRRHWWMLAFGLLHAALLWFGDIIGAYGLAGLLITWLFLDRKDKTLKVWAITLVSVFTGFAVLSAVSGFIVAALGIDTMGSSAGMTMEMSSNYLVSVGERLSFWTIGLFGQAIFGIIVPVAIMIAIVAARHRVLENPEAHRTLLVRTAVVGVAIGWLGGVPQAVHHVTNYTGPEEWTWGFLHTVTGLFGALGYAAVFALVAESLTRRGSGPVTRAITAVGKRSLSSYVLQSVLIIPVLAPWGIGLGSQLTEWQAALYALGVWLVTMFIAVVLDGLGKRGPLEWVLRKLSYRRMDAPPTPVEVGAFTVPLSTGQITLPVPGSAPTSPHS